MQAATFENSAASPEKKKVDLDRNYSDETFYTDSSEDLRSKCKSAATLLQKKRQLRPINGSGNPYRSTTRLTLTSSSRNNVSLVAQKIMSAKLLRVKQLQNELTDAQFQLNELSTENRILRTLQKRQDMALKKYEGTQAELPQLIRSHNEEVRTLKTKLKQVKSQCRELENNLKSRENELSALQEQHKHLIKLSKSKHLGEREQLQQQVEQMQDLLKEQDKKVQMLTRKLLLESKNYKHQLTAEIARHKRTARELDIALERIAQLESVLVAKEKYIAVNLARTHPHAPTSATSLGLPPRFQLFQTQTQSAVARISTQRRYSSEHVSIKQKEDSSLPECGEGETSLLTKLDKRNIQTEHIDTHLSQSISNQKSFTKMQEKEEDEEGEEGDTDEDYQQYLLSESTECHSYSSHITGSKSMENVPKDYKDIISENEESLNTLQHSEAKHITFLQESDEALETETKASKKRIPLRRYSVSGDSELIANDRIAKTTTQGSLKGAGDSGTTSSAKSLIQKTSPGQNNEDCLDYHSSEISKRNLSTGYANPAVTTITENAIEISQPNMTAEEHQLHLKAMNCTWNEIQNRIRDETIRAQSVIEKYEEEQRYVDNQIGKKTEIPESYDKNHLLAALRAIEGGADPIDLNEGQDEDFHLPACKPRKVEYENMSQAVENLHIGIPTRASSSVSAIENLPKDNVYWENSTMIPPNLIRSEMDMSKSKNDIMREIFGHHK